GAETFEQSVAALRFGGRISLIGNLAGARTEINLIPLFMRQIRVQGILVGSRDNFEAMNRAIAVHRLRPPVSRVYPLEDVRAALESLVAPDHFGKVAVRIG
ncbi:MAG: zinc-binding dehydrogenase, partial [Planctomycetota bacterium]